MSLFHRRRQVRVLVTMHPTGRRSVAIHGHPAEVRALMDAALAHADTEGPDTEPGPIPSRDMWDAAPRRTGGSVHTHIR